MRMQFASRILLTGSILAGLFVTGADVVNAASKEANTPKETKTWTDRFNLDSCAWASSGKNDFFILEPGDEAVFEGQEDKKSVHLVITVLSETEKVGGVETRIVEERESHNGE